MDLSALLTSAGINIVMCVGLLYVYSVLRKRPSCENVYFRGRPPHLESNGRSFVKFVPRWMKEAWQASEEEILAAGGLDAVVFLRMITFSIKIFSIAAPICICIVVLWSYFGKEKLDQNIPSMILDVFTIGNIGEGSNWLLVYCLALYIISCLTCVLLYSEYKNIAKMRLEHIVGSSLNPSYFTVLVRGIPSSPQESCSDSVRKFFKRYNSHYLSHQMVYRSDTVQKLMNDESKMIESTSTEQSETYQNSCGFCGGRGHSFKVLSSEPESVMDPNLRDKECAAALVFFKTRQAALVASQVLQSANPMSWVTDLAPEPHDVDWKNLSIPYGKLWGRSIATRFGSFVFVIFFILIVAFIQGLLLLEQLEKRFPFLSKVLKNKFMARLITGYLPSVVLTLFLLAVPPTMMLFSTFEGSISRSGRIRDSCSKVLCFLIWNVFFVNVLSANIIQQLATVSSPIHLTQQLAAAVPRQATFFMTYVMTSGWGSLPFEIMQPYALVCNFFYKYILRKKYEPSNDTLSFPYHTEVPRLLLFGFLGFTYSLTAPLILPLVLVFFFLASIIYRNQILNAYVMNYQSGGQFWPIMHNTTIFSLVLTQVISVGVFGQKRSPVAAGFTILLIVFTLLFNEYCRRRFYPIFKYNPAEDLIDMDQRDKKCGNMKVIHKQLPSAYCQFASISSDLRKFVPLNVSICAPEDSIRRSVPPRSKRL